MAVSRQFIKMCHASGACSTTKGGKTKINNAKLKSFKKKMKTTGLDAKEVSERTKQKKASATVRQKDKTKGAIGQNVKTSAKKKPNKIKKDKTVARKEGISLFNKATEKGQARIMGINRVGQEASRKREWDNTSASEKKNGLQQTN